MSPRGQGVAVLLLAAVARGGLAARWGVTMEEATHWAVGMEGAGSWFDRALAQLPRDPIGLRLPGVLLQTAGALSLLRFAPHPVRFAGVVATLPALGVLGLFATPSSWAIGLWALGLAAALQGGRAWVLTGLWAGLGATLGPEVAPTMVALPMLLVAGAPAEERRSPWPWVGLGLTLLCAATGSLATGPDPTVGPVEVVVAQLLWGGPVLALAVFVALREEEDRVATLARWAAVPVWGGAVLVAALGFRTPDAVISVAWWGGALILARSEAQGGWLGEVSAWIGLGALAVGVVHVERPVLPLAYDPAARLSEAEAVADDAVRWAMPAGERRHGPRVGEGPLLFTARPEEAAAIRYHTGLPAVVWGGCAGGALSGRPEGDEAVFVRPWSVDPSCVEDAWERTRTQLSEGRDRGGRRVGVWAWSELRRAPTRGATPAVDEAPDPPGG